MKFEVPFEPIDNMDKKTEIEVKALAEPALLDRIDKLFACGVGEHIALPQLVVVGDQSSGKSSVLEGLTKLPFPRDKGLCTRFATQITFRRSKTTSISISVIPARNASKEHEKQLKGWHKDELKSLDAQSFADIMAEVQVLMGLGTQDAMGSLGSFSEDVLRLEICGPDQEHFSVVDVPGIFRKKTDGLTTTADIELVKSMVRGYMANPRSVMLAVIPANVDVATQDILTMAEEEDPEGIRTLGVLTKPDLIDKGAESAVIELLKGTKNRLNLGWCIVKNPGQSEVDQGQSFDRDTSERRFFREKAPWNTLDPERLGVSNLRTRLQEILATHIRREFPKVRSELTKLLKDCQAQLKGLGDKRETPEEQRGFLLGIAEKFQATTTSALNADYVASNFFDENINVRIPTAVVTRNKMFSQNMTQFGHAFEFKDEALEKDPQRDEPNIAPESNKESEKLTVRSLNIFDDLEDVTICDTKTISTNIDGNTMKWLKKVYETSRGFELGTFDKNLLASTMKTQSAKWEALSQGYISDVIQIVHLFITELLEFVCPIKRMREEILAKLMDELLAKYKRAFDHVLFLLQVERTGIPATLDKQFSQGLETSRHKRVQAELAKKGQIMTTGGQPSRGNVVTLDDINLEGPLISNMMHTIQDVHDILKSYYDVARTRFVDSVCMQAANHFLLKGCGDGPLQLFSSAWVSSLKAEELEDIAGEDTAVKRKRASLNKTITNLQEGKKVLC